MKLSTRSRYAIRILAQIAVDSEYGKPASGRQVAASQGISGAYMEQILIPLRNAGFISTVRGRNGGYFLTRPPEEITFLDMIELFEGRLELIDEAECGDCPQHTVCPTTDLWKNLSDGLRRNAAAITLQEVIKKLKVSSCHPPDFVI